MAKRITIGRQLREAREKAGMSAAQLVKRILDDHGKEMGESTVRDIESDKTPNPGIKTIEAIALGVGLNPLEVISLGLDDPPEMGNGFKASQFAQLYKHYSRLGKDRRPFADEFVQTLIEKFARWA